MRFVVLIFEHLVFFKRKWLHFLSDVKKPCRVRTVIKNPHPAWLFFTCFLTEVTV